MLHIKSKINERMYFFFLLICKDSDEMLTFQFAFSVEIHQRSYQHEIPCEARGAPEMIDDIRSQKNMYKASAERDP